MPASRAKKSGTSGSGSRRTSKTSRPRKRKPGPGHLLVLAVLGGILGLAVGRLVWLLGAHRLNIPPHFLEGVPLGIDPPGELDFGLFRLTLGMQFRMSLMLVPGAALGVYLYTRYFNPGQPTRRRRTGRGRRSRMTSGGNLKVGRK